MITFDNVTMRFVTGMWKKRTVTALDRVSIKFPTGRIYGVLGENGAGKTTMIKLINGLLSPTHGHVAIDEMDWRHNKNELYSLIGTMLEGWRTTHWPLSVRQNMEYFGVLKGLSCAILRDRIETSIDFFRLRDKADAPVKTLSQGMKRKLALAIAMISDPKYLLLDEPLSGIDHATSIVVQDRLKEWVYKNNRTIIVTTHDMHVAHHLCDHIIIIRGGKILVDNDLNKLVDIFSKRKYQIRFKTPPQCRLIKVDFNSRILELSADGDARTYNFILNDHDPVDGFINVLSREVGDIELINCEKMHLGDIYSKLVYERQ